MERFFLRRASAIAHLLKHRRAWSDTLADTTSADLEIEATQEIQRINRFVLDVRAGRLREVRLDKPTAVEIIVTD